MVEVMVAADSTLVGKTVIENAFRDRYRLRVIGLRRGRTALDRWSRGRDAEDMSRFIQLLDIGARAHKT